MAGGQERALRRRIRTVSATRKITRAMELIAASEMVRAQSRLAGARPYVGGIARVLAVTAGEVAGAKRLIGTPETVESALLVVVVSDRGLAGGYNNNVLRAALRHVRAGEEQGRHYRLVTVGRKAISFFRFNNRSISESFTGVTDRPRFEHARRVSGAVITPFLAGEVDLVEVATTRFISAGTQRVEIRPVLPLPEEREDAPGTDAPGEAASAAPGHGALYEFEPDPADVLELLVPQYAEAMLYQVLLEASASEHTARQRAMASATENADDLITTYRRAMNRARQDSITTEIMEIVGGAEALRAAGTSERGRLDLAEQEERSA